MQRWGNTWVLTFNPDKCNVISIKGNAPQPNLTKSCNMGGKELSSMAKVTDLGIQVDDHLDWSGQIRSMVKKANTKMWLLIRNIGFNTHFKAKKSIYMSFVRSKVEYCSTIWSPHIIVKKIYMTLKESKEEPLPVKQSKKAVSTPHQLQREATSMQFITSFLQKGNPRCDVFPEILSLQNRL